MKYLFIFLVILFGVSIKAQIVSVRPNHANRGETLTTTITPYGGVMTISSGMGSSYLIFLQQSTHKINASNYTYTARPGLGFADSAYATFNIPMNALPGFYDVHVKNYFDFVLTNGFLIYETMLKGNVYFDANQNGIRDAWENGIAYQSLKINPGGITLLTDYNGDYRAFLNIGTFQDSILVPQNFTLTSSYNSYSITVPPDDTIGNDFGLYTPPSTTMIHNFISNCDRIRCQRHSNSFWQVTSLSNNIQNGTITIVKQNNLTYINSTIIPTSISNDTIRWNYTLNPFQSLTSQITFQGGPPNSFSGFIAYDTLFDFNGNFFSTSSDSSFILVHCSYDPNEKSVLPEGIDSIYHYTLKNETLKYFIRFQNCGTDTAFNITVRDTINPNLNINTLHILYSSSPVSLQIENNHVLQFKFNNIQLPDSNIDELHSHGIIFYSIEANPNVADYTRVENKAYIYFDLNPFIATNKTFNTLISQIPDGIDNPFGKNKSIVFPNPITENSILILPDKKEYLFSVFDLTGREVFSFYIYDNYILHADYLPEGIFYYKLFNKAEGAIYNGKFVIVH